MKKYELIPVVIENDNLILHRIKALKDFVVLKLENLEVG